MFDAFFSSVHPTTTWDDRISFLYICSVSFLTPYKDPFPIIYAAITSIIHHILFNFLQSNNITINDMPLIVFNNGCGWNLVLLHGFFVIIESIVLIYIVKMLLKQDDLLKDVYENLIKEMQENKVVSKQAQEFSNALDNSAIVSKTDPSGVITYVNKMFCDVSGYSKKELIGKRHNIVRHPDMPGVIFETLWSTILAKQTFKALIKNRSKDGNAYYVDTVVSPILDVDGNIVEFIATRYDVTNLIIAEEKAKSQEEILLQQSRMAQMGELISMIAHQWKQPLSQISSISSTFQVNIALGNINLDTEEEKTEFLTNLNNNFSNINNSIKTLSITMDDFRNFFNPNKRKTKVPLSSPVSKALQIIGASLIVDNITIEEEYADNVSTDMLENEVIQVVLNILKNAQDNFKEKQIKNPKINIKTSITSTDLRLEISDNGGGINEDILNIIFEKYFSTKPEKEGTGLGLHMCKTIIEAHNNGKFYARNTDEGVSFIIELPR